jgi:hypothetical protein
LFFLIRGGEKKYKRFSQKKNCIQSMAWKYPAGESSPDELNIERRASNEHNLLL